MRGRILKALESSSADYTDIRIERELRTRILYQDRRLDNIDKSLEVGGIVRCRVGGGWGMAITNSLDELERRIDDAYRIAGIVNSRLPDQADLSSSNPIQDEVRVELKKDLRSVPLQEKQKTIQRYNDILLKGSSKIVMAVTRYTDSFKEITFANSEGTFIYEERPDVTLLLSATARGNDTNIQRAFESNGWAAGYEVVEHQEEKVETVLQRALDLLDAQPVKGGVYTVILDQNLTGTFIHEAFGHLCEADNLFKNPSLQEILVPGRMFGVDELNVFDEGYLPGLRGNSKYDDEGTLRRRATLIENGVLQGYLHTRETAARMGADPTGNARALSYRYEPIVRMRNTFIDRGSATFDEMIGDIDYGIYACGAFGGQTELEQFTFSAAYAYEVVNGQLGGMLREVVLTGNVFDTLKNIDMIGDDLVIKGSAGGCGKAGQSPLSVTHGGPHIRVRNLTIGGRAS